MTDGAVFQGRKRNLSQHKQIRKALGLNAQNYSKVSEDSSLQLFNSCSFLNDMPLAFCIIELVFDAEGHGVDFVFRYCNDEMAVVEGIPVSEMLNRSFYEVFENGDKKWLVTYADVAGFLLQDGLRGLHSPHFPYKAGTLDMHSALHF